MNLRVAQTNSYKAWPRVDKFTKFKSTSANPLVSSQRELVSNLPYLPAEEIVLDLIVRSL